LRVSEVVQQFKGIGDVGANIFCREAQLAWDELHPFVDCRALEIARRLGLPATPDGLAKLVDRRELPRLVSGLVRVAIAGEVDEIRRQAA